MLKKKICNERQKTIVINASSNKSFTSIPHRILTTGGGFFCAHFPPLRCRKTQSYRANASLRIGAMSSGFALGHCAQK
jgi:hypothetical protein